MSEFDKINTKVASMLGMRIPEDDEFDDNEDNENKKSVVSIPDDTDIILIDNADLPDITEEFKRIEHTSRITEYLTEIVIPSIEQNLMEVNVLPPIYKARAIEVNAKMLEATNKLLELRVNTQIKSADLKMKAASFTKNKSGSVAVNGPVTNNFYNREELIKKYQAEIIDENTTNNS
jgi:vacuolar-type H+-ATPase subunit F/Vma7